MKVAKELILKQKLKCPVLLLMVKLIMYVSTRMNTMQVGTMTVP